VRPELRGHGRRGAAERRFGPISRGIGARRRAVSSLVLRESSPDRGGFAPFGRALESADEGGVLVSARAGSRTPGVVGEDSREEEAQKSNGRSARGNSNRSRTDSRRDESFEVGEADDVGVARCSPSRTNGKRTAVRGKGVHSRSRDPGNRA